MGQRLTSYSRLKEMKFYYPKVVTEKILDKKLNQVLNDTCPKKVMNGKTKENLWHKKLAPEKVKKAYK